VGRFRMSDNVQVPQGNLFIVIPKGIVPQRAALVCSSSA
jgi:hypothetical protein